ncbi:Indigoidine synthase A like protein-domain-containing protein [Lipomyces arxii]|uniref:Indigoidine synthase A like protein-domain-containing protein n=1 Tax=Lipomyces arxii TaxID=56418 RepID=UPI0034CF6ABE
MRGFSTLLRPGSNKIATSVLVRKLHTFPSHIAVAEEVKAAIHANEPVVALESTILTHGIPYPYNIEMAIELNKISRSLGVVPATIALINGVPTVGATDAELEYLCQPPADGSFLKVSRRDLAYMTAHGVTGGTTIAGTSILAHLAGIRVFATGGLGGVHRGAESTLDISADLEELGRTPIAVVSAGAKAILDLNKTFEYLETKGVHVSTYGPKGTNIPAFYSRDSGIPSPFNFDSPEDAAAVIHANSLLGLQSGMLFCIPPPHEFAIPAEEIDDAINTAVIAANEAQIKGKAITPFLLNRIFELTEGRSLKSNIGFVKNNVAIGASIAKALSLKEKESSNIINPAPTAIHVSPQSQKANESKAKPTPSSVDCVVVGAIALDLTCDMPFATLSSPSTYMHTSNPGTIHRTPGGVGFNLCLAASLATESPIRMISAVGPDCRDLHSALSLDMSTAPDLSGVLVAENGVTAQYIAMHDSRGDLIFACADMSLVERLSAAHIAFEIERAGPLKWIALDANLDHEPMQTVLTSAGKAGARVLLEPTASIKSQTVLDLDIGIYPRHSVEVATPNTFELEAMFKHARSKGLLEQPEWWKVIDACSTTADFRNAVEHMAKSRGLSELVDQGIVPMGIHMLPFIPNLFVKVGQHGVFSLQLMKEVKGRNVTENQISIASGLVVWRGNQLDGQNVCIVVRHHAPHSVDADEIVSVTGAGDSFVGVLLAELLDSDKNGVNVLEDIDDLDKVIDRAQRAAILTLKHRNAISPEIQNLPRNHA